MHPEEEKTDDFKDWKRNTFHDILMHIYEPLRKSEEDGINMICPDGERRLCHPILAQYISDYQEQALLASITFMVCPKCTIPRYRFEYVDRNAPELATSSSSESAAKRKRKCAAKQSTRRQNLMKRKVTLPGSGKESILYPARDGATAKELRNKLERT